MTIGAPRYLLIGLAALFSSYHIVLGVYSFQLGHARNIGPIVAAMIGSVFFANPSWNEYTPSTM